MVWGKLMQLLKHRRTVEEPVDPIKVALDATINDLQRVASDLRETNRAWNEKVIVLKEGK